MENRYKYTNAIPYEGTRHDMSLGFHRLMAMFQEASIAHSDSTNLPLKWFTENQRGFLLTHWHVKVESAAYPPAYDTLTIYTWPVFFKGISAQRAFDVYTQNGTRFAAANTRWAFTNLAERRPVRIPPLVSAAYGECLPPPFEANYEFPETEGYTLINTFPVVARICDIDSNLHVNNVKYIEWVVNGIPEDMYRSMNVREMKTVYKKEVKLNDELTIETYKKGDEILSRIVTGGALCAEVYTKWETVQSGTV